MNLAEEWPARKARCGKAAGHVQGPLAPGMTAGQGRVGHFRMGAGLWATVSSPVRRSDGSGGGSVPRESLAVAAVPAHTGKPLRIKALKLSGARHS